MGVIIPQVITNRSGAQVIDGSLKINQTLTQHLSKTFGSSGNRKTITWSAWVRRGKVSSEANLFSVGNSSTDGAFRFNADDTLQVRDGAGGELTTEAVFRDTGWYHIVVKIDTTQSTEADRFRLYVNGSETVYSATSYASEDADIDWNNSVNHYIGRQVHNTANLYDGLLCQIYFIGGQALGPEYFGFTDTLTNTWKPKKYSGTFGTSVSWDGLPSGYSALDATQYSGTLSNIESDDGNYIQASNNNIDFDMGETITASGKFITAKWTSYVSDSSSADYRIETSNTSDFSTVLENSETLASENTTDFKTVTLDLTQDFRYIRFSYQGGGRVARLHLLNVSGDGQNSFYLPMDNEDDFEKDKSGNGNDWTKNNFSGTSNDPDVLPDSPSGISYSTDSSSGITTTSQIKPTTWATLNTLNKDVVNSATLTDGNLKLSATTFGHYIDSRSTLRASTSNCYCEMTVTTRGAAGLARIGVGDHRSRLSSGTGTYIAYYHDGDVRSYPGNTLVATESSYTEGDVIGMTINSTQVAFYKNNTLEGTHSHNLTGDFYVTAMAYHNGNDTVLDFNFGQKPFKYAPPDGFRPLCDANTRPDEVISSPNQYVGIITYNGNGGTQNVSFGSTINFDGIPDLVWIKHRTRNQAHVWYDSVRTAGTGKAFNSNDDGEEGAAGDGTTYGYLSEFTRNGFTVIDGSDAEDYVNKSGAEYVAWCWKAGGAPTATNTQSSGAMTANSVSVDGVLQSAYTPSGSPTIYPKKMSVGTKQGFSIVQYVGNDTAGATLPHGLTKAPDFFVTKADYDGREWQAYHKSLGNQQPIRLNTDQAAQAAHVSYFNNTSPTASVVTFGNGGDANQGGETPLTYIMYAWHDVPGLQKFGTYIGNQNADGPYIELGFRPKILWIKSSTTTQNWYIHDAERNKFNPTKLALRINQGREQTTTTRFDFLSNGFKIRGANLDMNDSGETFIYCAWAEVPSVDLFGGGANAR